MKTPAIIILCIWALGLLSSAHDHGKPRNPTSFWVTLIAVVIEFTLLYWGGFFK